MNCPHCQKPTINLKERLVISNWFPSTCSICGKEYVNSEKPVYLSLLSGVLLLAIWFTLDFPAYSAVIALILWWLVYAVLAKPIKYEDLKMYSSMSVYKKIIFYLLIPVATVVLLFSIAIFFLQ